MHYEMNQKYLELIDSSDHLNLWHDLLLFCYCMVSLSHINI